MWFARQNSPLSNPYSGIAIYADLSQHTMLARKKLVTLTKLLRNNQLTYSWGFPTKLLVIKDGRTYAIRSLDEGLQLTRKWGLLPSEEDDILITKTPGRMSLEWKSSNDTWLCSPTSYFNVIFEVCWPGTRVIRNFYPQLLLCDLTRTLRTISSPFYVIFFTWLTFFILSSLFYHRQLSTVNLMTTSWSLLPLRCYFKRADTLYSRAL